VKAVIKTFVLTAAANLLLPDVGCAITGESAEDLEVRSTVSEFYAAVSVRDIAALRRCTTPAFHLVMNGVDYDLEATIESILEEAKHGRTTVKTSNIRVERNGPTCRSKTSQVP
jgi:hypothetical protein